MLYMFQNKVCFCHFAVYKIKNVHAKKPILSFVTFSKRRSRLAVLSRYVTSSLVGQTHANIIFRQAFEEKKLKCR